MSRVTVLREQPATPPITEVSLNLTLEEAQELAGILGVGSGLVNELYFELCRIDDELVDHTSPGYRRGVTAARDF